MRSISVQGQGWQREQRDDLTLREIWYVLWNRRRLVLSTVAVLVFASFVYSFLQERVYIAEATIQVTPQKGAEQDAESFLQEVGGAVNTEMILTETMKRAGAGSEQTFEERLEVSQFVRQDGQETGYTVRFSGPDAQDAAKAANAYATLFVEQVGDLNDRLAGGSIAAVAEVGSRATPPDNFSRPRPMLYAGLSALAGIIAGGALALLLDSRTRRWRGARDAEMTLRAPVLGVIPDYANHRQEGDA